MAGSQGTSTSIGVGGGGLQLRASINFGGVISQLAHLPSALIGTIGELNYDLVKHHKLSILSHLKFPAGRRAQQMVATRLHGYGRSKRLPQALSDVVGESFAAADSGRTYGPTFFKDLEAGRVVESGGVMAVPIGAQGLKGEARAAAMRRFEEQLANHELVVTPGGYLINARKQGSRALRTAIVGVLTHRRRQRPMLGFFKQFESVWARHSAKYDKAMELSMTAAGQEILAGDLKDLEVGRAASSQAFRAAFRAAILARPNEKVQAIRAARAAAKLARAEAIAGNRAGGAD